MDRNAVRMQIATEIAALANERNATQDPDRKKAIKEAIDALQETRDTLDETANDQIGARVDALVAELEAVQNRHSLDAGSAVARAIGNLRGGRRNASA